MALVRKNVLNIYKYIIIIIIMPVCLDGMPRKLVFIYAKFV